MDIDVMLRDVDEFEKKILGSLELQKNFAWPTGQFFAFAIPFESLSDVPRRDQAIEIFRKTVVLLTRLTEDGDNAELNLLRQKGNEFLQLINRLFLFNSLIGCQGKLFLLRAGWLMRDWRELCDYLTENHDDFQESVAQMIAELSRLFHEAHQHGLLPKEMYKQVKQIPE